MKTEFLQQKEEKDILLAKSYQPRGVVLDKTKYLKSNLIKLITGPRRAGKSVVALQLLQNENFAYINFDDTRVIDKFDEDVVIQSLHEVYPKFEYLLLDEIQNLPNWEVWVAKLYRRGINLIITGSNARLLSNEMATLLTGRYLQIEILPFSLAESIDFRGIDVSCNTPKEKALLLQNTEDYMIYGGFPETVNFREILVNYLGSLFDSILLKDVTKRFNVRGINDLYNLANYLLSNYCNLFSISSLSQDLNIGSKATVQKFCNYLSETYLFFYLPRFNNKLKLMQKSPQKIYVVDSGFIASRSFELSANKGRLLENMVFVELIRRGYKAGQSLFYYRTRNDKEIDFVCKRGHIVEELIQVSYDISNDKTLKRELSAIKEAKQELNCHKATIITFDDNKIIGDDVNVVSVWNWSLDLK